VTFFIEHMIKQIGQKNILISPFTAVTAWELSNVDAQDLVLLEEESASVIIPDTDVAVDYVDYTTNPPSINNDCNIALEQQSNDIVTYQEGITGSGLFYPDSEPQNTDGTFKRLVFTQIQSTFYNKYLNPLQIFGTDYIDFQLSKTNRNLSTGLRVFTIPQITFGDRVMSGSVILYDTSMDDNVIVQDDGYQNLFVGTNLFSKIQEVRPLSNSIASGSSSQICPSI
jgi:hypothetical protein